MFSWFYLFFYFLFINKKFWINSRVLIQVNVRVPITEFQFSIASIMIPINYRNINAIEPNLVFYSYFLQKTFHSFYYWKFAKNIDFSTLHKIHLISEMMLLFFFLLKIHNDGNTNNTLTDNSFFLKKKHTESLGTSYTYFFAGNNFSIDENTKQLLTFFSVSIIIFSMLLQ